MSGSLEVRRLAGPEIEEVLARNHIGRLAFSFRDRVDIEPIHYVYHDGWIYGRTSAGEKLSAVAHNHWVAFEVDESDSLFDWRSVVVHGGFYRVPGPEPGREPEESYSRALAALRTLIPETLTGSDPVADRRILFRIPVQEATGRAGSLSGIPLQE